MHSHTPSQSAVEILEQVSEAVKKEYKENTKVLKQGEQLASSLAQVWRVVHARVI